MPDYDLTAPPKIEGDATFARNGTLRLQLRRWWTAEPKQWVGWLMLNPSNANASRNDPTMLRVIHFSQAWGYDGCIVVNLYPLITSAPREMWDWRKWQDNGPDWEARDDIFGNLHQIEEVGRRCSLRVAAFGTEPLVRDEQWVYACIEHFTQPYDFRDRGWIYEERAMCLGLTKSGAPVHPLARGRHRVPDDAKPVLWEAR